MPNQYTNKSPRAAIRPIGPSIAYIKLSQGLFSLVDACDADELEKHWWFAMKDGRGKNLHYVGSYINGKLVKMHRFLVSGQQVDHKNLAPLDNRRSANLRPCTRAQNNANRSRFKTNTSGYQGITERTNGFVVRICVNYRRIVIGTFKSFELAVEARKNAELEYFGEFANPC